MGNVTLCVVAWVVVWPLLFVVAVFVWRAIYQRWRRDQDERETAQALARVADELQKLDERLNE